MARSLRIEYPGAIYHAMSRGNNGQETFVSDDGRRLFLATLSEACEQTGWWVHAYVLMPNHYHLLLETPEPNLVAGMKWFQGAYTQRFNAMFGRRGHLFQGRYKAIPVQTSGGLEYFRRVSTYIHLNPYRAKMAGEGTGVALEQYAWSSYPAYSVGKFAYPAWLVREKVLGAWGILEGDPKSLRNYRSRIERIMKFREDPDAAARGEFEKQVKRGWFIGSEEFRDTLFNLLDGDCKSDNYRGVQRREHNQTHAEMILAEGLAKLGLREEDILRMRAASPQKQALAWAMKSQTTVTGKWIAERLEMGHPENASLAIRRFRRAEDAESRLLKQILGGAPPQDRG